MKSVYGSFCSAGLLCFALTAASLAAEDRPRSGKAVPGYESLDRAILKYMDEIDCRAATLAVSKGGRLIYSRGYGWIDEAKKKPIPPDALMRIASVTKPITAAAVKNAVRARKFSLDAKAFTLIDVKAPKGKIADPRINEITVRQLLEHKGGWDRGASFDPMFHTSQITEKLELKAPVSSVNVIEYMLTQPLQFKPGEKSVYSNFGYCVLGRVLEKTLKKPYFDCVRQTVCNPLKIKDIKMGHSALDKRDAREVWYPVAEDAFSLDIMDAHGGLIASAPALCQFLQAYWITGDPRLRGQRANWTFFGSLPGTTAMARQRSDGINIALLLNGRREKHIAEDNDTLKRIVDENIEKVNKRK